MLDRIFHAAVQSYLEEEHGYDFIHEIIGLGFDDHDQLTVEYRGIHGEYSSLTLNETLEQLLEKVS